jgi:hypothetical protein
MLELSYPVLDDVEVWVLKPDNTLEAHYRLGDKHAFTARPIPHRFFLIPMELSPEAKRTVVLRLHSTSSMQAPLTLWREAAYFEQDQKVLLAEGLFFGGISLLVVYSFFVFVALRERMYFYFVMCVFGLLIFLASLKGFTFQFFWPQATDWNDRVLMVSLSTMLLFGGLFTYRFLGISTHLGVAVPEGRTADLADGGIPAAVILHGLSNLDATLDCGGGIGVSALVGDWRMALASRRSCCSFLYDGMGLHAVGGSDSGS